MIEEKNPVETTTEDGTKLYFHEDKGNQKCIDCYITFLCPEECVSGKHPCNSQDRTDGKVGHWEEKP